MLNEYYSNFKANLHSFSLSIRKQPKFCNPINGFSMKWCLRSNDLHRNSRVSISLVPKISFHRETSKGADIMKC